MRDCTDDWQDYGLEKGLAIASVRLSIAIHYILYLLGLLGRIAYSVVISFNAVLLILVPFNAFSPLRLHSGKCCKYCHRTPKTFRMRDCFGYQWGGQSYFESRTNCWDPIV